MFDSGYYKALHSPNMELIADDVVTTAKGNKVYTKNGRTVKADVIVLATVSFGSSEIFAPVGPKN